MSSKYKHRKKHKRRLSTTAVISLLIIAAFIYVGTLIAVKYIGNHLELGDMQETVGSLDDRFAVHADQMITLNGETLVSCDVTNILLIGIDWDEDEPEGYVRYAGQSDFLMMLVLDKKNETVSALQLDRDTITDIHTYGPFGDYAGDIKTQLCLAYAYGGTKEKNCENTVWAVSNLLGGVRIDGYIALDMDAIALFNDALGGVTVKIEDDFGTRDPEFVNGKTVTLHGSQAETFVRGRKGVGDGLNTSRMRRQRVFIREAEKLFLAGLHDDMGYAGRVYDAVKDHISTNLSRGWLINKAYECSGYTVEDVKTPVGEHEYGVDGYMEFHPDEDALSSLIMTLFCD